MKGLTLGSVNPIFFFQKKSLIYLVDSKIILTFANENKKLYNMSKKISITASVLVDSEYKEGLIESIITKNFGKTEITNIHSLGNFVCFNINNAISLPLLLALFAKNLQLYVNKNNIDMSVFK